MDLRQGIEKGNFVVFYFKLWSCLMVKIMCIALGYVKLGIC